MSTFAIGTAVKFINTRYPSACGKIATVVESARGEPLAIRFDEPIEGYWRLPQWDVGSYEIELLNPEEQAAFEDRKAREAYAMKYL